MKKKVAEADLTNLIIALVSVVIGFGLAIGWDQYKATRDEKLELARAERSVSQEIAVNLGLIQSNLEMLNADIAAADRKEEVILPLDPFLLAAGQTAYLKGSLESNSMNLALHLRQIYSDLEIVNQRINARDLYRATNGAMSNFGIRRKAMNEDIKFRLEQLKPALNALAVELKQT